MAPRSSILILLLTVAITASPLQGLVHAHAPDDGSGHSHHHFHDGHHHSHFHHHHGGDDADDPSGGGDHHSVLDHAADGLMIAWSAPRRGEVAMATLPPVMVALPAPRYGDWLRFRRAKPPPLLPHVRSSQTNRLRTVILQV